MAIADRINEMYTHVGDVYDTITNVDLPTNKNIQNIPSTMRSSYLEIMNNGIDKIWNNWEKVTGSGTELSLSPTLEAPMKNVLNGNTYQFTTTGKNLLDTTNISTISTQTGITITPTYEEGLLKNLVISGTPTTTSWNTIKSIFLKAGSYILTGLNISDRTKTGLRIGVYIDRDRQYFISANSTSYSFTLSEDTGMNFVVWVQSVIDYPTGTNIITPMIRLARVSDDTYEPYTGGQASPNPDFPSNIHVVSGDNAIQIQGPNYFDYEDTNSVSSQITTDSEGWISCTYDNSASTSVAYFNYWTKPINVKPSTNYLLVLEVKSVSGSGRIVPSSSLGTGITQFETTSKWFSEIESNKVYTFPITSNDDLSSAVYSLRSFVQFNGGQSGSITFRLSVLNDTTITANTFKYYPYSLDSYPINLPIENLFDKNTDIVFGSFYNSTGEVQTDNGLFLQSSYIKVEPNTEYTFSGNYEDYFRMCEYNSSKTFIQRQISTNGDTKYITYTTTANTQYIRISCNSTNVNSLQIERDNKINSYTPYGTTPIELCDFNTYKDNFLRTSGKNLYDGLYTTKTYVNYNTGEIRPSDDWSSTDYIEIKPNTSYTFSGVNNSGWVAGTSFYDSSKTFISSVYSTTYTFTTPSNAKYLRLSLRSETPTNIMLNEGNIALPYEPYGSGKRYLHKEIGKVASYNGETITTSYISTTGGLDTGATVYYVLSTPTNTEITYQPLIEQLNELEKAISYENQTNISQVNNDLPFIISASALKKG